MKYILHTTTPRSSILDIEHELNEQQREVVLAGAGPHLVIAGAGSGKTRTLTYRAAYLVSQGLSPTRMLACTFTNRAAREMVQRIEGLISVDLRKMWAGTFHHVANLALRQFSELVGLTPNYAILDREDARDLLGESLTQVCAALPARHRPQPGVLQHWLSLAVDRQVPLAEIIVTQAPRFIESAEVLTRATVCFAERKRALNLVDYDDLQVYFYRLLVEKPAGAADLFSHFEHVLVDEYQDTSLLQGKIIDACAAAHGNLTAVGDDAQSIYAFRGADFRNIIDFAKRYPTAQIHKLEQNYRSTPQILNLANLSIARNQRQYPKTLAATRGAGIEPVLIELRDVDQQAAFIAQRILELNQTEKIRLDQMAILYRAHNHSLELQVELTRRGLPFLVRSGLRFFEQAHIKDVLAYVRISHNPSDVLAWQRILRTWPGIGSRSATRILDELTGEPSDLPQVVALLGNQSLIEKIPAAARSSLKKLATLLKLLAEGGDNVSQLLTIIVEQAYGDYAQTAFANAQQRLEDLQQLARYGAQFSSREQFLSELALAAGMATEVPAPDGEEPERRLTLSTIHQAKGLEWRVVFLLSLSEGKFPQAMALRSPDDEEEERRLFHVASTRAMDQLYLCHPQFDENVNGPRRLLRPSRFLTEIITTPNQAPYERWTIEENSACPAGE